MTPSFPTAHRRAAGATGRTTDDPAAPHRIPRSQKLRNVAAPPSRRFGWFADRPIGVKIGAVIALLAIVVLATNALAVNRIQNMRSGQEAIYTENHKPPNSPAA